MYLDSKCLKTTLLKWYKPLFILAVLAGIVLRVINGLVYSSFSMDEIWLGLNIKHLTYVELFSPLDYNQSAPILFLLVEKFFYDLIQLNIALKIPVTIISISSLILFQSLLKRFVDDKIVALAALFIFSFSPTIIWMSICVKQYSVDMLVVLILLLMYSKEKKITAEILLVSSVLLFASNIVLIIVFGLLIYSLINNRVQQMDYVTRRFMFSVLVFLVSGCVFYIMFVQHHPAKTFMNEYWEGYFLPILPKSELEFLFFPRAIWSIRNLIFLNNGLLFSIAVAYSMIRLVSNPKALLRNRIMQLLLIFITIHLFVSSINLYPFYHRFLYYITPFIVVMMVYRNKSFNKKFFTIHVLSFIVLVLADFVTSYPHKTMDMSNLYLTMKDHPKSKFIFDDDVEKYVDIISFQEPGNYVGISSNVNELKDSENFIISFLDMSGDESKRLKKIMNKNSVDVEIIDVQPHFILYQIAKDRPGGVI